MSIYIISIKDFSAYLARKSHIIFWPKPEEKWFIYPKERGFPKTSCNVSKATNKLETSKQLVLGFQDSPSLLKYVEILQK